MADQRPSYEELLQLVANLRQQIAALRPEAGSPDAYVRDNALRMIDHTVPEIQEAQSRSTAHIPVDGDAADKTKQFPLKPHDTRPSLPKTAPLKRPDNP